MPAVYLLIINQILNLLIEKCMKLAKPSKKNEWKIRWKKLYFHTFLKGGNFLIFFWSFPSFSLTCFCVLGASTAVVYTMSISWNKDFWVVKWQFKRNKQNITEFCLNFLLFFEEKWPVIAIIYQLCIVNVKGNAKVRFSGQQQSSYQIEESL